MGIECIVIVYGDGFSLAAKYHMHNIFSAFIAMYTAAEFNPVKDVGIWSTSPGLKPWV